MHKIINSDIFSALNSLQDNSIDIAITSPPYWAQRNYGFDKQIGNEETYIEFISRLVFLFNKLRKKLNHKGVFFLNIGDKYLKKYGKTPIGLIPYKLAHFMQKDGWYLNETIMWYKPNHMPSSVKNRFANSYEPVFVLSKEKDNYFTDYIINNPNYSNILEINLQPTSYNHIATYPEKLVSSLLDMTVINKDFTVLDPFAGSGTTLKVIRDNNNSFFNINIVNGIMIEYNNEYIDIIKKRTSLSDISIEKYSYLDYDYDILKEDFTNLMNVNGKLNSLDVINITSEQYVFYSYLNTILDKKFISSYPKKELLFIGLKEFSIEDIYNISLINNKGWIIRNMVIVKDNKWHPIFMIVHDNKKFKYFFNYKQLKLSHKSSEIKYFDNDFIGYKVVDNMVKEKKEGKIISITERYTNGLPKYVKVYWGNETVTTEFVINDDEKLQDNIKFNKNPEYLKIIEIKPLIPLDKKIKYSENNNYSSIKLKKTNGNYNGKFKEIERKNWGASPGARSSVEEEVFSLQRLYSVNQNIIADYLNYIRKQNKLTKKAFTELFPVEYKHTVGHWLRKDFGGSIPIPDDWKIIMKLFSIDKNYTNYVCKTALKLQAVQKTKFKIPDDLINHKLIENLTKLNSEST